MKNVGWKGRYYKPIAGTTGNLKRHEADYKTWQHSIALFGESTTWGHEVEPDQKLHNVIKTDRTVNNFAYPAESNFHMWMKLIDQVKNYGWPYMVVMGWTTPFRMADFKTRDYVENIGNWNIEQYPGFLEKNETNLIEYSKLIMDSTQLMCKGNTKLFEWSWFDLSMKELLIEKIDYSKDGVHPGPESIQNLARKIENEF